MKLSKERVRHLAQVLNLRLQEEGQLSVTGDTNAFMDRLEATITAELSVEDRLNAEVREMLKAYADQIERGQVDYQKMFTMIKSKLVRDRGLIL
ncbi:hypothetical protein YTPLAS18_14290 [Nitrospira sp.]|nr:hypothetical protein YTPLAS18_14290 [Nitrospira sp.]